MSSAPGRAGAGSAAQGARGEQLAASWLEAKGYELIASNFTTRLGELDLVMRRGKTTVFVEVKYLERRGSYFPEEQVTRGKLRKMSSAAKAWLQQHPECGEETRFDVLAISPSESRQGHYDIAHYEDALEVTDDHG